MIDAFSKGGYFRFLAAEEHTLSIGMTTFMPRLPIAAITDEFSPALAEALPFMREIGMTGAELRVVDGKNILDLGEDELKRTRDAIAEAGLKVVSIASPLLKCVLPNAPELDSRFQHDVFASKHTYEDQPRLTEHAIKVTQFFGAPILRVFSYWRTVQPGRCEAAIAEALSKLAGIGEKEGVLIGLENEHASNIGTAAETARILSLVPHNYLKVVWDPANALCAGEDPFPRGYALLPKERIAHVHAKDCHIADGKPVWGPLGTRHVRWKEQIQELIEGGYAGYISLETHWRGPNENNKLEASRICGWNLRGLVS
jgi:sugar phosphate isomerase/epimerase